MKGWAHVLISITFASCFSLKEVERSWPDHMTALWMHTRQHGMSAFYHQVTRRWWPTSSEHGLNLNLSHQPSCHWVLLISLWLFISSLMKDSDGTSKYPQVTTNDPVILRDSQNKNKVKCRMWEKVKCLNIFFYFAWRFIVLIEPSILHLVLNHNRPISNLMMRIIY